MWAYAALLAVFLVMAAGLVIWGRQLLAGGLGMPLYFFALVPLALGAAGFLHGALGAASAELEAKVWYGQVRLTGPLAVFGLVLGSGIYVVRTQPEPPVFSVTVRVHGPAGAGDLVPGGGRVILDIGGDRRIRDLATDGAVTFSEIPAKFDGQPATVTFSRPGFTMTSPETVTLTRDQPIALAVTAVAATSRLRGTVLAADGQPLAGATLLLSHGAVSTTTDANGNFAVDLAVAEGTTLDVVVKAADGQVVVRDFLTTPGPHTLKATQ